MFVCDGSMEVHNAVRCAGHAPPIIFQVHMELKSGMVPHTHMYRVNASLNCISPPKCASINPKKRNTDRDEEHCISVAVQLISEIRWRPFREMRTESESWRKGEGESAQPKVMGQMLKERQARRQRQKHSHKIGGRDSFGSVCLSHFLYSIPL